MGLVYKQIRATLPLLVLGLAFSPQAQAQTPGLRYAVVPVQFKGDYQPVDSATFMQRLQDEAHKLAPNVSITVVDVPEVKHWDDMMAPDPGQVQSIIKRLGVDRLVWGSVRFNTNSKLMQMGGGQTVGELYPGQSGAVYRYMVTVAGAADFHVADGETGKLLLDQPFAIFRTQDTAAPEGTKRFDKVERELGLECSADLATQIVTVGKKRLNP